MNEQITSHTTSHTSSNPAATGPLRTVLWAVLVLGAVGNMIASTAAAGLVAHLVLGAVTAVAAAGLIASWLRARA